MQSSIIQRNCFVLILLGSTSLLACRSNRSPELSTKNEVTIGTLDVMITINPLLATDMASKDIHLEVWQSLNQLDRSTCHLMPVLASLPKISADLHVLSYLMDPRARWSDGFPVTPEDIIYTFKTIVNPAARVDMLRDNFAKLDSVWSPAPGVVSFHFSDVKFNRDYDIASVFILPKHVFDSASMMDRITWTELRASISSTSVRRIGEEFASTEKSPDLQRFIGSGPYVFEEWERGQFVKLRKNPNYWADKIHGLEAYPNRLMYRKIGDENARVVALKAHEIDLTSVSSQDYLHSFSGERWSFIKRDTVYDVNYSTIEWNNECPLFALRNVRKALTMLVNRDAMLQVVYHGLVKKVECPVTSFQPGWDSTISQPAYDPTSAKQLLAEDGWMTDRDGILHKILNGKNTLFRFTFMATSKAPQYLMLMEDLRKVGIEAKLMIVDFATALDNVRQGSYDAYFGAEGWDPVEPDLSSDYHTQNEAMGGSNKCRYSNPIADSLLEAIQVEMNRDRRLTLSRRFQHVLAEDQPETFLFSTPTRVAWLDRFDNVRLSPVEPPVDPRFFIVRNMRINQ
jgi:peptide/nickel transport system substrate-binding protein